MATQDKDGFQGASHLSRTERIFPTQDREGLPYQGQGKSYQGEGESYPGKGVSTTQDRESSLPIKRHPYPGQRGSLLPRTGRVSTTQDRKGLPYPGKRGSPLTKTGRVSTRQERKGLPYQGKGESYPDWESLHYPRHERSPYPG